MTSSSHEWECALCTFTNDSTRSKCKICHNQRQTWINSGYSFSQSTTNINHNNNSNRNRSNIKKCIIILGTSGTGKSTMVKNLTGSTDVKTSSSHRSCTTDSKIYSINSNLSVLDTVGCEDTTGLSTNEILNQLVQFLAPKKLDNIQIIWTVNPNEKSTPELRKQARWINKLHKNIWKSTLLICKKGDDEDAFQGALGAVLGQSDDEPACKLLHLLDELKDTNLIKRTYKNKPKYEREKDGILYNREVKDWVLTEMNKLSTCGLSFEWHHPGYKKTITEKYHWGTYSYKTKQVVGAVLGNIFTLGIINAGKGAREDMYYYYWDCCDRTGGEGCRDRYKFGGWSCCSYSENSSGCCWKITER